MGVLQSNLNQDILLVVGPAFDEDLHSSDACGTIFRAEFPEDDGGDKANSDQSDVGLR
jgi:hypothetical protein